MQTFNEPLCICRRSCYFNFTADFIWDSVIVVVVVFVVVLIFCVLLILFLRILLFPTFRNGNPSTQESTATNEGM